MAGLAMCLALPMLANAQDINLATGGADLIWKGTQTGANAGAWMDLGDMSGDARRDLIIGAPGTASIAGRVYVIFGGPDRTGQISLSTADVIISSTGGGNQFGFSTAAGNVLGLDNTNPKDLAVGAPGASGGRGAVYLFATDWNVGTRITTANARLTILGAAGDQLGTALATGDLDKDGRRELIIGAPGTNRIYIIKGSATLSGTIDLSTTAASATFVAAGVGRVLMAGDITGDGIYDVLAGVPSSNLVFGLVGSNGTIPSNAALAFIGSTEGEEVGSSIRILDLDDDGKNDVAIGAPGGDGPGGGRPDAGHVYVYFGPVTPGPIGTNGAHLVMYGSAAGRRAGQHMATGDINRDTPNDLVILAPGGSGGAGELNIFYGRVRAQLGTGTGPQKVVDMAVAGQVNRRIFGNPGAGTIAAAQVYEVTGEGARDIMVGVPGEEGNTGSVYFTISPRMRVSRLTESMVANQGNSATSATPIDVTNPSIVVTGWQAVGAVPWLSASPASGSISQSSPGTFYVVVNAAALAPGTHTGTLNVRANSPDLTMLLPIQVTVRVTGASVAIDTPADNATVSNGFQVAGWAVDVAAASGTGVTSVEGYAFPPSGGEPTFLGVATYGGSRPDIGSLFGPQFTNSGYSLTVRNLTPGASYRVVMFAKSSVSGTFAASKTVNVTISSGSSGPGPTPTDPNPDPPADPNTPPPVDPGIPTADTRVHVNRSGLWFAGTGNGSLLSGPQTFAITFTAGSASWSVTTDATWLTFSRTSGKGAGAITVSANPGSYANGSVRGGTITVTAPGVANSPLTIPVQLAMRANPGAPGGVMETPTDNSTGLVGNIAVTGWAVDDIGISEVTIWRDPVAGESVSSANGKVFIGKALQVDGARPDVDALFAAPFDYQAGWGYLLLTNFLPNQGNGTYRLHAFATDVDGHTTLIGSKTIVCDNAHATKPFGTIDTPAQGATVSGNSFINFGWVLGAQDNVIPIDGSTITVFVDGVPVGHPEYNFRRSDIETLFPGHANTSGAVGFFILDTTRLSNGVHTIAWGVTDAAGHSEGIGSRFFTVLNTSSSSVMTTPGLVQGSWGADAVTRESATAGSETGKPAASLEAIAVTDTPSYAQKGFTMNAPLEIIERDAAGPATLTTEELGVIRATVGAPVFGDADGFEGYSIKGGRLDALPSGSFLDRRTGEFFWHPGVGFVGTYDFVFIRKTDGLRERIPLTVVIEPRTRAKEVLLPSRTIR